jgi:hypothetical protein
VSSGRRWALAAITAICSVGVIVFLIFASSNPSPVSTDAKPVVGEGGSAAAGAQLMARAVDRADPGLNGKVFVLEGGQTRDVDDGELSCERIYFAGGRGLCLATAESGINYEAKILNESLETTHTLKLAGIPSRARVSRDGRYGAMTVFVNGHAYLAGGGFSTATTIVDMSTGESLGNLETFKVFKDGSVFEGADFNFWGVTFADNPDRFFATLRTGGHYYLVEGSVSHREVRILRDRVECPSLSPDGTRIAYKSRIGDENRWRLKVLDLKTLKAHPVAERRPIDDQPEWLNDTTLVYSDGLDIYTVASDGSGVPRRVLKNASSPVSLSPQKSPAKKPGLNLQ